MKLLQILFALVLTASAFGLTNVDQAYLGVNARNYIKNGGAEQARQGWATYADAAGTTPVDCTGGSPSSTWTTSTTTPLSGTASFIWTHSANNRQGEGVSYAFTVDNADQARIEGVSFDYEVASGTFVAGVVPIGGATAVDSDLEVYVYDVTNSTLIQPSNFRLLQNSGKAKFQGTFQTASNSTSYRLCLHVPTTSASAHTVRIDSIKVGPQITTTGPPVTDWKTYTPTFVGFGTVTNPTALWKQVGDSIQIQLYWVSGTATATTATVTLPFGSADSTKLFSTNNVVGAWSADTNAAGTPTVLVDASATVLSFGMRTASTSGLIKSNGSTIASAGQNMSLSATLPITGLASSVAMGSDVDGRVVAARAYKASGTQTVTTTPTAIALDAIEQDTHGAFNTSTSLYVIPVPGFYDMLLNIEPFTGSTTLTFYVEMYVNTVLKERISESASSTYDRSGAYPFFRYFNAGDSVQFKVSTSTGTISLSAGQNGRIFSISRRSGPAQIAAADSVNALYESNTARSISNSAATTGEFLMEDKIFDTHGAYNASTAIYTVPIAGKYRVAAMIELASSAGWDRNELLEIRLYKNASLSRAMGGVYAEASNTFIKEVSGNTLVSCVAGDTLEVRMFQNSGGAILTSADQTKNWVSYNRIGN